MDQEHAKSIVQNGENWAEYNWFMEGHLRPSEFAKKIRITKQTALKWINLGQIKAVSVPKGRMIEWWIPKTEVDRILEDQNVRK